MTRLFIIFSWCTLSLSVFAQTNITLTNAIAMDILMGDYSSSDYVSTTIIDDHDAIIRIQDMQGNRIKDIPFILSNQEITEIMYYHGYGVSGVYSYSLVIDDEVVDTKRMIFNN
jgi:hypothetical protein